MSDQHENQSTSNQESKPSVPNNPVLNMAHIIDSISSPDFVDQVAARIDEFQSLGLEVEVQYRQSDETCSVLLLARRGRTKPGPKPGTPKQPRSKSKVIKNLVAALTNPTPSDSPEQ